MRAALAAAATAVAIARAISTTSVARLSQRRAPAASGRRGSARVQPTRHAGSNPGSKASARPTDASAPNPSSPPSSRRSPVVAGRCAAIDTTRASSSTAEGTDARDAQAETSGGRPAMPWVAPTASATPVAIASAAVRRSIAVTISAPDAATTIAAAIRKPRSAGSNGPSARPGVPNGPGPLTSSSARVTNATITPSWSACASRLSRPSSTGPFSAGPAGRGSWPARRLAVIMSGTCHDDQPVAAAYGRSRLEPQGDRPMTPNLARVSILIPVLAIIGACGATPDPSGVGVAPSPPSQPVASAAVIADPPITLRLAVADSDDSRSRLAVDAFVQQVAARSGGSMTVVPTFDAGAPAFEQGVVRLVQHGETDLALAAARAWDLEGEPAFEALHAPFLVDNDALADAIAGGAVGRSALDVMTTAVGLDMWQEDQRHVVGFSRCGHDYRLPSGVAGSTMLVQPSGLSARFVEALGATAFDALGADRNIAAEGCTLHGMEGGLGSTFAIPMAGAPVVYADLPIWTKFQVLAASQASFDRLTDAQQGLLAEVAAEVAADARSRAPREHGLEADWCAMGGEIEGAGADARTAWERAVAPLYAELEADPGTAAQIAAIRDLAETTTPAPGLEACPAGPVVTPVPIDDLDVTGYVGTPFPNGTFRRELVPEDMIAAGLDPDIARDNEQVLTFTFDDGTLTFAWDAKGDTGSCQGTYESVDGVVVTSSTNGGGCGIGNGVWREEPDGFSFVWLEPTFLPSDHIMLDHWVWTRIE